MYDPAQRFEFLEMEKPIFTLGRLHPGTLMGTIQRRFTLFHHPSSLIRSIDRTGTHHHLPTFLNTTGWKKDVVIPVVFMKFGAFTGVVAIVAVKHEHIFPDGLGGIR
ncbi:MAG: hypothetical protein BWY72_02192 [Bacteroidetes bacterium ADurb.Bin416]|nr:MAG: hypothetical protein BWY72_02192 [Bacteroidetes bacterium ADurb.Bin416]